MDSFDKEKLFNFKQEYGDKETIILRESRVTWVTIREEIVNKKKKEWPRVAGAELNDSDVPFKTRDSVKHLYVLPGYLTSSITEKWLSRFLTAQILKLGVEVFGTNSFQDEEGHWKRSFVQAIALYPKKRIAKVMVEDNSIIWIEHTEDHPKFIAWNSKQFHCRGTEADMLYKTIFNFDAPEIMGRPLSNGNWSEFLYLAFKKEPVLGTYIDEFCLSPRIGLRVDGELLFAEEASRVLQVPENSSSKAVDASWATKRQAFDPNKVVNYRETWPSLGPLTLPELESLKQLLNTLVCKLDWAKDQFEPRSRQTANPEPEPAVSPTSTPSSQGKKQRRSEQWKEEKVQIFNDYGMMHCNDAEVIAVAAKDFVAYCRKYCVKKNKRFFHRLFDEAGFSYAVVDFSEVFHQEQMASLYLQHLGHLDDNVSFPSKCKMCLNQWHFDDRSQSEWAFQKMRIVACSKPGLYNMLKQQCETMDFVNPQERPHYIAFRDSVWDIAQCAWMDHQQLTDNNLFAPTAHLDYDSWETPVPALEMSPSDFLVSHPLFSTLLNLTEENWLPLCGILGAMILPRSYRPFPHQRPLDEWQLILQIIGEPGKGKTELMKLMGMLLGPNEAKEVEFGTLGSRWANTLLKESDCRLILLDEIPQDTKFSMGQYNKLDGSTLASSEVKFSNRLHDEPRKINVMMVGNNPLPFFHYSIARRTVCFDFDEIVQRKGAQIYCLGKRIYEEECAQVLVSLSCAYRKLREQVGRQSLWKHIAANYPWMDEWTSRLDDSGVLEVFYEWLNQGGMKPCECINLNACDHAVGKKQLEKVMANHWVVAQQRNSELEDRKKPTWIHSWINEYFSERRSIIKHLKGRYFSYCHQILASDDVRTREEIQAASSAPNFQMPSERPMDRFLQKRVRDDQQETEPQRAHKRLTGSCVHCGRRALAHADFCAVVTFDNVDQEYYCELKPEDQDRAIAILDARCPDTAIYEVQKSTTVEQRELISESVENEENDMNVGNVSRPKNIRRKRCAFIDDEADASDPEDADEQEPDEQPNQEDMDFINDEDVDEEVEPTQVVQEETEPEPNLCSMCDTPMGDSNPRQLCGKNRCLHYSLFDDPELDRLICDEGEGQ